MTSGGHGAGRRAAAVRTFLIADIRGYTRFTAQYGDEAASRLARRFAEIAGEGIEAWGGELVELRGDEALAVFDSARQALRCAVELQAAFRDETASDPHLPLSVGIGLDAGEAVPVDDGYRGAALNMAARLCASALGGETVASRSIMQLAGPVPGLGFGELTKRTLKGIEEPAEAALVTDVGPAAERVGPDRAATAKPTASTPRASMLPAALEPVVPLVGRESELRWLRWHWRRARHGHGRTVVVSGPPGIGKTRLAAELATIAHAEGASVTYLPSTNPAGVDEQADDRRSPSLVVFDDIDAAGSVRQQLVVEAAERATTAPRLVVVIHREEAAAALLTVIDRLATPDRRQALGPLEPEGLRAIVALYAGSAVEGAPLRQLMDESGGLPAAIHRVAATWARSAATRQLGASAERTESGRRDLRTAQDELIDDVATLERIRERSRRFDPDGPGPIEPTGMTICPYKGLAAFDAADAEYYFGRDRLVAELVAKLVGNPFLGFVGASGSGKSSALRAGLLPALAGGVLPGSDRWLQVVVRPGEHPMAELSRTLTRALPHDDLAGDDGTDPLQKALARLPDNHRLILVVDQFEEVFAATRDEAERGAFIEMLTEGHDSLKVIVAIRADHYGHCAAYPTLARLVSATHVLVGPLTAGELEAVIEAPAERVGLRVQTELVRELVADAGSEPGVLPLLSTALLELWQARERGWLTLSAYGAGGGLHGAVARLAEAAYAELDPGQAAIARSIFLRLAGPGEGEGVVRRRPSLAELDVDSDAGVAKVLEMLTGARLLTMGDGFVEVAHEALLREWPRLQTWLEEDAEGRRLRLHLIGAARDWDQRDRQSAELYRGARLSAALDWAAEHQVELNATEREFLEASRLDAEREVEKERRTNRRLRVLLTGAAGMLVVALAAGGLALAQANGAREQQALAERREAEAAAAGRQAETARQDAETAARFARSRELAASSTAMLDRDPALAKLLAVEAANIVPPDIAVESALHQAWSADHAVARWAWPHDVPFENLITDLHPDGRFMVASGDAGKNNHTLMVVDLPAGRVVWSYRPVQPQAEVEFGRFTPDGSRVVAGVFWAPWDDGSVAPPAGGLGLFVWDTATGRLVKRVDTGPCGGKVLAVAAGVALVGVLRDDPASTPSCYAGDGDHPGRLESVDLTTGKRSILSSESSEDAALSDDGRYAAFDVASKDRSVVMDLATGKQVLQLDRSKINGDAFVRDLNADGTLLLYGDRPLKVFDVATGAQITTLANGEGQHFGVGFGSRKNVYSTGSDASLSAWDAASGALLFTLPAAGGGRPSAAADGRVLVSDYISGQATLFDPRKRGELGTVETCPGFVPGFQLEVAGGEAAFSISCDDGLNEMLVVDTRRLAAIDTVPDVDGQDIALSADGTRLAAGTSVHGIMRPLGIYDAQTGRRLVELKGLCSFDLDFQGPPEKAGPGCKAFPETPFGTWPFSMGFSPNGRYLAELDVGIAVWSAATGESLMTMKTEGQPWSAIFTPDSTELLVSTADGELMAISTETWNVTRRERIDESVDSRISLTGFLPDGRTLIGVSGTGGSGGGSLHRIDVATLKVLSSNRAHDGAPKASRLSDDGKLIVTGAADGVVRVWDAATGTLLHELRVDGQAQGVAFLDDDRIAVAPQAGGLLIFSIDPQTLLTAVRASIQRGFTPEECARFNFNDHCPSLDESRATATP